VVVVRVDDRDLGAARALDRGHERGLALAEGLEQPLGALVAEILDDVDEEKRVLQGRGR
jgi:hypothetical protein